MTKKQKKNKKTGTASFKDSAAASPEKLLGDADAAMTKEKYRDTLALLKQARKSGIKESELAPRFFRASLHRARQLYAKAMETEGDAMANMAVDYLKTMPALQKEDLRLMADYLPLGTLMACFKTFAENSPEQEAITPILCMRLFAESGWNLLDTLPPGSALRNEAEGMMPAIEKMNTGAWEDALSLLRSVPKESPFAPVRIFCTAMCAFLKDDSRGILRALSALPDDFPLPDTLAALRAEAENKDGEYKAMPPAQAAVFRQALPKKAISLQQLKETVKDYRKWKSIPAAAMDLAVSLDLDHKKELLTDIFETMRSYDQNPKILTVIKDGLKKHLPHETALFSLLKIGLYLNWDMDAILPDLIPLCSKIFTDSEEANMARGMILIWILTRSASLDEEEVIFDLYDALSDIENLSVSDEDSDDMEIFRIAILAKALEWDPKNRDAWEMLRVSEIIRKSAEMRRQLEPLFIKMQELFPKDPFPCLELATLYDLKGAHRKAESAMLEARKRAPHDPKVNLRYAISLLVSAKRSLGRKKVELALEDLKQTEALKLSSINPHAALIRLRILEILEPEKTLEDRLTSVLQSFPKVMKLKIMAFFYLDRESEGIGANRSTTSKQLKKIILEELKAPEALPQKEMLLLLSDFPEEEAVLYRNHKRSPMDFLLTEKINIINRLSDEDFCLVLSWQKNKKTLNLFKNESALRVRKVKTPSRRALFIIIQEILKGISSGGRFNFFSLEAQMEKVDAEDKERVRKIARTLADFVPEYLQKRFKALDFNENMFFLRDDDDYYDDDDDDDLFDYPEPMPPFGKNMPNPDNDPFFTNPMDIFGQQIIQHLLTLTGMYHMYGAKGRPFSIEEQKSFAKAVKALLDIILKTGAPTALIKEMFYSLFEDSGHRSFHNMKALIQNLSPEVRAGFSSAHAKILFR
ncbi:tetratricopeptide repeat protein [Desulfobotulus mexicanus]|uniref:Tetratricopeptide repeat protein n=1 Tax=Desulfobotulus mexicanus TaxID=2586642 RepID=A0A5S5MEA3_9BACT|nr:hypothetical protein [Desulfobotulus mexicanus]TYT73988.1 hypothetical protein FIM25_12565 [Desulfobotulus mexicanus]